MTGLPAGSVAEGDDDAEQGLEAVQGLGSHALLRGRSTPQELEKWLDVSVFWECSGDM